MGMVCCTLCAQTNPFLKDFENFRQKAKSDYEKFRDEANRRYADLLRGKWHPYEAEEPLIKPKDNELPPVVIDEEEERQPVRSRPVVIEGEPITLPFVEPQPEPLAPIMPLIPIKEEEKKEDKPVVPVEEPPVVPVEVPPVVPVEEPPVVKEDEKKEEKPPVIPHVTFGYFGTPMQVSFSDSQRFKMTGCTSDDVADGWERMIGRDYDNTLYDCLELRKKHQMSDWAYLLMLDSVAHACADGNEATLMLSYLYQQSGYKIRMGVAKGRLYMLFASDHTLYERTFFNMDGTKYHLYGTSEKLTEMEICEAAFPKERELSLWVTQPLLLSLTPTQPRVLTSRRYADMSVEVSVNRNLINFYEQYPPSMVNGSFMTRWAMLARTPFVTEQNQQLIDMLRSKVAGLDEKEAVERLLNWVQTAFVYEYDDKVWGGDRAFFPDETLYYPYCDCEDRSILLSRLVTDLLGLKCTLIYYPGHLAMAVHFNQPVDGDYVVYQGERFVVCDPTYINARIGRTMRGMDNSAAKLIVIQ